MAHESIVKPALELLRDARFQVANAEFLAALEDFRLGRLEDALTKCGSAFESTMKVICSERGWAVREHATASPLLKMVLKNTDLEDFYEQPLILIATLRNRLSSAHGGGVSPRTPRPEEVEYCIHASASAALLLVRHTLG